MSEPNRIDLCGMCATENGLGPEWWRSLKLVNVCELCGIDDRIDEYSNRAITRITIAPDHPLVHRHRITNLDIIGAVEL